MCPNKRVRENNQLKRELREGRQYLSVPECLFGESLSARLSERLLVMRMWQNFSAEACTTVLPADCIKEAVKSSTKLECLSARQRATATCIILVDSKHDSYDSDSLWFPFRFIRLWQCNTWCPLNLKTRDSSRTLLRNFV